jgi:DHA2 family multidrug resistance protein
LLERVTAYDNRYTDRLNGYTHYFSSQGNSPAEAGQRALGAIDRAVNQQSTLLSYMDGYLLVGIIVILALPLLLLTIGHRQKGPVVVVSDH